MRRVRVAALLLLAPLLSPGPARAGFASVVPALGPVNEKLMCPKTDADPDDEPTPSLSEALSRLEAVLRQGASPAALRALDASPESRDPQKATLYAAAALATKRPMAALGLLLRAQRAAPQDPGPLTNLAAVANDLGKHREALALALAAEATRRSPPAPRGLDGRAVLQNNKGHALLELGKPREAQAALQEAIRLQPDLSEAYLNAAYALGDQGQCDKAVRFLRAGSFRHPVDLLPPGGDPFAGPAPIDATRPPLDKVIDLSRGKPGKLPTVKLPVGPEGATMLARALQGRLQSLAGEQQAGVQTLRSGVEPRVEARRQAWRKAGKELSLKRSSLLQEMIRESSGLRKFQRTQGPEMDRLDRDWLEAREQYQRKVAKATDETQAATVGLGSWYDESIGQCRRIQDTKRSRACEDAVEKDRRAKVCALGRAWGNDVMPYAVRYDTALRGFYRESFRRASAAASYFGRGPHQEWARLQVDLYRLEATADLFERLHDYVGGVAYFEETCGPGAGQGPGEDDLVDLLVCKPLEDTHAKVSLLSVVEVGVNCEDVEVELSTPGCVGAFAQVGYEFGTGDITIFGGVTGKAESGASELAAKAGAYYRVDRSGRIVDAGVRVETSATVGAELGVIGVGIEGGTLSSTVSLVSGHGIPSVR